jgi:hypothetical protein
MAYTQKFGRPSLGGNGEPFIEKGLITPTDPKPNGVVVSSDKTFADGVTNELDTVMLTGTNTKKKVDRPKSLRDSILDNTADDSYSMYNANTNRTTNQIVDPISGTNFDKTTYSNPETSYTASTISGNKSVTTSSSRYPNQYSIGPKSSYIQTASENVGTMPSARRGGFQETYSDGNFVRNTRSGKIQSSVPKKDRPTNLTEIKKYRTHLKDSTNSRNVRVRGQVKNELLKDRAGLLKDIIKKNN